MQLAKNTKPAEDLFAVVHEDANLLVINKPAGLVCHPTKGDEFSSLVSRVRLYFCQPKGEASGWHLVNRLDRETSGIVVAKHDQAAREIRRVWESRAVEKIYFAVVHGWPDLESGAIDASLGKDEQSEVAIKDRVRADGLAALTRYEVKARFEHAVAGKLALLKVQPETGRKHQIRIHLSHIGHPILGDKLYGRDEDCYLAFVGSRLTDEQRKLLHVQNHALHAASIRFDWSGREWRFEAEPESEFQKLLPAHGGSVS
jgi:23S rRNA pseudouridine1911/1915/1917 synthase